jgi:hypothetical protein
MRIKAESSAKNIFRRTFCLFFAIAYANSFYYLPPRELERERLELEDELEELDERVVDVP